MNSIVQNILDIALAVSCNDHVYINDQALHKIANEMLANPMPEKQVDKHKIKKPISPNSPEGQEIILKELVSDSVNYCYWLCDSGIRPNDAGSTRMRQLLEQSFDARLAMRSRLDLVAQLRRFHRAMMINRFPLMDRRRQHLHSLARPMVLYGATNASAHNADPVAHILVKQVMDGVSLDNVLDFLICEVDGFGDDPFLKRAFLFFLQLNRILGLYANEVKEFPIPADYQVPKMLHYYNVLEYSEELEYKVQNDIHLAENSPEEMAIRAAAIIACKKLGEITGWPASDVDGWFFIRRKESAWNFHLTITSNY